MLGVIGLTVVAVGTSLPELIACVIAVLRKHADVALGNIVGSNIYNVLGILGLTSIIQPIEVPAEIAAFDIWVMLGVTALFAAPADETGGTAFPLVPGHEIVGHVTAVGGAVSRYRVGDRVAVGCLVDSCQSCDQCDKGEEQLCREGNTQTYNGRDRITGEPTYGGYSKQIVERDIPPTHRCQGRRRL